MAMGSNPLSSTRKSGQTDTVRANAENVGVVGRHAFRLPVRTDSVDESSSLLLRLGPALGEKTALAMTAGG